MITQDELELMAAQIIANIEYDEYGDGCRFCDAPFESPSRQTHEPTCVVLIAKRVLVGKEGTDGSQA